MPYTGTSATRKYIFSIRLNTVIINVSCVCPIPFIMLVNAVETYRNGQSHESITMYEPASVLWKKSVPISSPNTINIHIQSQPISRLYFVANVTDFLILAEFFSACACAIDGSSITANELLMADGKRINGIAIPDKIPYMLSASAGLHPYFWSAAGIKTASALCKSETISLVVVSITESERRVLKTGCFPLLYFLILVLEALVFIFLAWCKEIKSLAILKIQPHISPARIQLL